MAVVEVQCPECGSPEVVRYGRQANGEQRYRCNNVDCTRRIFFLRYHNTGRLLEVKRGFVAEFRTSPIVCLCEALPHPTHTVLGMPNCVIRLSTAHFTTASVRWVARPRAQSRPPKSILNRNMVFSATLCRV